MEDKYQYQHNFSQMHGKEMYNISGREQKAKKIIAVLADYYHGDLRDKKLLDVGCSTGIISNYLARNFREVVGIDIDKSAVEYAQHNRMLNNANYYVSDGMNLNFPDGSFDIVNCSQIYEHVPNAQRLMDEINRVLKKGGICFFAAGNRIKLIEEHYKLPLLSIFPKPISSLYLRLTKKGKHYYENLLTYWGLRKIVSKFRIIDYTIKITKNPEKFEAIDMLKSNSFKQKAGIFLLRTNYWIFPSYVWLLRKD
ncbi:class I SAM-dependent methyltransferase [Patescibacteria group bacterium]|nr:class I SAM-dependent methyltransferase [Patescibacteria group bacterium]